MRRARGKLSAERHARLARSFWERVDRSGGRHACWLWLGYRFPNGFGKVVLHGRQVFAHRVASLLTHGSLPNAVAVVQSCGNRACCNPAHLQRKTKAKRQRAPGPRRRRKRLPVVYTCVECSEPFRPFSRNERTCSPKCNRKYWRVRWLIKKHSGRAISEGIIDRVPDRTPRCRDCKSQRLEYETEDGRAYERCGDCGAVRPVPSRVRRDARSKRYDQRARLERELAMNVAIASEPTMRYPCN